MRCKNYPVKQRSSCRLQYPAWLAIFALLVQVLLPAIVHAAAPGQSYLAEVCTASGVKTFVVELDAGDISVSSQHCPVCNAGDIPTLPGGAPATVFLTPVVFHRPPLSASQAYSKRRLIAYLRGPPLSA
jgi:hypothetical protein